MSKKRRDPNPIDEQLLRWEQARGTMPPNDLLGTEYGPGDPPPPIDQARLQEIREACARTRRAVECTRA